MPARSERVADDLFIVGGEVESRAQAQQSGESEPPRQVGLIEELGDPQAVLGVELGERETRVGERRAVEVGEYGVLRELELLLSPGDVRERVL